MHMPQVIKRRIGDVYIFDLRGNLVGPWARKEAVSIEKAVNSLKPEKMLVNLKGLENIDSLGVKAVVENIPRSFKGGFIEGSSSIMQMFNMVADMHNITIFRNDDDVLRYFGKDFVETEKESDRRKFARLKTALKVDFSYERETGSTVQFRALVTDLSEGGLFIEYLDLDEASAGAHDLNPYDFKLLKLKIHMPDKQPIIASGKVVRVVNEGEQIGMGIEWYEISDSDKRRVVEFLK